MWGGSIITLIWKQRNVCVPIFCISVSHSVDTDFFLSGARLSWRRVFVVFWVPLRKWLGSGSTLKYATTVSCTFFCFHIRIYFTADAVIISSWLRLLESGSGISISSPLEMQVICHYSAFFGYLLVFPPPPQHIARIVWLGNRWQGSQFLLAAMTGSVLLPFFSRFRI
jgi:hypothetical protein